MRRLYLASDRVDGLPRFLGRDPRRCRLAFVPTASNVVDDGQETLAVDRERLLAMGFRLEPVELEALDRDELEERLTGVDVLFVSGGNAFYLLHHAIRSGLTTLVPPLVRSGRLTYVGVSAGAVLAGPDLLPGASESTRWKAPPLPSTRAMGLVPFRVLPHFDQPGRAERLGRLLTDPSIPFELVPLTDEEAVEVRGTRWRRVSAASSTTSAS